MKIVDFGCLALSQSGHTYTMKFEALQYGERDSEIQCFVDHIVVYVTIQPYPSFFFPQPLVLVHALILILSLLLGPSSNLLESLQPLLELPFYSSLMTQNPNLLSCLPSTFLAIQHPLLC
jgi:hypothetical protein